MKVGLITSVPLVPPWDQGDKNLAYSLALSLPHIRFEIFTTRKFHLQLGNNINCLPIFSHPKPGLAEKAGVLLWLLFRSLSRVKSGSVDLYHLIYQPTILSSRLLKRLALMKSTPVLHTIPASSESVWQSKDLFFADYYVTLSEFGKQSFLNAGIREVQHIPAGINFEHWDKLSTTPGAYKNLYHLHGKQVVLYTGHYIPGYGIEALLSAWKNVVAAIPNAYLVLACRKRSKSDHHWEGIIRKKALELGLENTISHLYTVNNMETLIGSSDLLVFPFESQRHKVDIPTTALEALAAGKPVLLSDLPPMNELLISNEHVPGYTGGWVLPPHDEDAWTDAMIQLLSNESLRKRMGMLGKRLIAEKYDIRNVARRYEDVYHRLLQLN
jgi:phosphatidylinositol alpha-1,6-mannosyltransferase